MSQHDEPAASAPADLPALATLGLSDPPQGSWAQLRGFQYFSLPEATFIRACIQGTAALATAMLFYGQIHIGAILAWLVLIGTTVYRGARFDWLLADVGRRRPSRRDFRYQTLRATVNAFLWVVPIACFNPFVGAETQLKLWIALAMLMMASAILLPAMPMATVILACIVGTAAIVYFLINGEFTMAILAILFHITIVAGTLESARRFLKTRIAEAGIAEKNEVVSLLLREFEEGTADWLWQIDALRRVRAVSPRFAYALGQAPAEIEGKPLIQLIAGSAWETGQFSSSLRDLAETLKRREHFSNLLVRTTIGDESRWWELSGTPRFDEAGGFDGFLGVGSDVTEARATANRIAYLARYDTLTGLPNRMMLTETLADALAHAAKWRTRCAFLMIDLDRFKAVNDSLGHPMGDRLLALVSERLQENLTDNELCGRLGGDEFAIVIRNVSDFEHITRVAGRVIDRLSQPYEIDHHTLYIGASVGSAMGPHDGATVETLMRNADLALYRAKDEGRGTHCVYEPALQAHAEERRQLELSLRHALERGELLLNYQPVVDAGSEAIVGFEALLRWNSHEHGFVSPGNFVPVARDTRLIVPIGQWMLREACHEAMNWPDHVRLAVNVSKEQLLSPDFAASVVGALSASGLSPQRLEVEVTESTFVQDAIQARAALVRIMTLGCTVALDDFGTGYSSLGYLRKLRFSTIKIDRTFVQSAATGDPDSLATIRAVVAMADSLNVSTTAEGVETERELEIARQLGCRQVQGYFFGRPVSAEDAAALFQQQRSAHSKTLA